MIPVKVKEIAYDVMMNPVILLIDEDDAKALPIWVGPFEAHSIALALQGNCPDRPMTHDLLKNICGLLEIQLSMVLINDVKDGTYFAQLHLWHQDKDLIVDSRPSDAIALALRTQAPIYISEKVAEGSLAIKDLMNEELHQELKEMLENNRPNDIKKSLH